MKRVEIPLIWVLVIALILAFLVVRTNVNAGVQETDVDIEENETELNNKIDNISYIEEMINSIDNNNLGTVKDIENVEEKQSIPIEEVKISRDMDLSIRTGLSKNDFVELINNLKRDTSGFFKENAETIYDLCKEYNINELFFCGLIAVESGWNIASNHRATYNYISLMGSNGLIRYSSVEEGLEKAASKLHNSYLEETGRFYHGKTLVGVKTCFCPASDTWVDKVYGMMQEILRSAKK